jgi:hypothetical protein
MVRKGRELEVGIEDSRKVGRLERDVDFDIAYRTKEDLQLRSDFPPIAQHLASNRRPLSRQ